MNEYSCRCRIEIKVKAVKKEIMNRDIIFGMH
jgi:hypothetical protein